MTGLDSNILIRYFVQDDPLQSERVRELLENRLTHEEPGYISLVTIAETTWVLSRRYRLTHAEVALAVDLLLQADSMVLQNDYEVRQAVIQVQAGLGSFNDALIAALGAWAGCDRTVTFDRKAARLPGVELL